MSYEEEDTSLTDNNSHERLLSVSVFRRQWENSSQHRVGRQDGHTNLPERFAQSKPSTHCAQISITEECNMFEGSAAFYFARPQKGGLGWGRGGGGGGERERERERKVY
jgi:hypothetical protein